MPELDLKRAEAVIIIKEMIPFLDFVGIRVTVVPLFPNFTGQMLS